LINNTSVAVSAPEGFPASTISPVQLDNEYQQIGDRHLELCPALAAKNIAASGLGATCRQLTNRPYIERYFLQIEQY
jgi:hypothetical protein